MADNPAYANYGYQEVRDRLQSIDLASVATAQNLWDSVFQGFTNLAADLRKQHDQLKSVWTGPGADTYGQVLDNLATELENIAKQAKDPTYRSFWQSFATVKDVVQTALNAFNGKFKEVQAPLPKNMTRVEASQYQDGGDAGDVSKFGGDTAGVRALFNTLARDYRDIKDGLPSPPARAQGPAGPADAAPSGTPELDGKGDFSTVPGDLPITPADAFGKLPDGSSPLGAGIDPQSVPISPVGGMGGVDVPGGPGVDVPGGPGISVPGADVPGVSGPGVGVPDARGIDLPATGADANVPGYTGIDPSTGLPYGLDPATKLADFQPASGAGFGAGASGFGGADGIGAGVGGGLGGPLGAAGAFGAGADGASSGAIGPGSAGGANGGAAGAAGMGYPGGMGGGMGHGAGKDGEERQRQSWIPEDQDIWGADSSAPPPVIGRG